MDYSAVFTRLGKIVKHLNAIEGVADTTIPAMVSDISAAFASQRPPVATLEADADAMKAATDSWRLQLAQYATDYLLSDEVAASLRVVSGSVGDVLGSLIRQMATDGASIDASAVTVGTVTPNGGNIGTGKMFATAYLDGVNSPADGYNSIRSYAGLLSELCAPSETVSATCAADSFSDGRVSGRESFRLSGQAQKGSPFSYVAEGSGSGPTFYTVENNTLLANGDFESFTSNVPDDWTLVSGTAGTNVTSSTSNKWRGASSLKLLGDGTTSVIELTQSVTVTPLELLAVSVWVKASAGISAGTLAIKFTGTGYTASGAALISIAPGALPTTWTHYTAWVVPPAALPSDWKLSVSWSASPQSGAIVYLDNLSVSVPQYHGGIAYAVSAGDTDFVRADSFSVAITNSQTGVFQEFFRRVFNCQLPSSGSPTIADSLAT